MNHAFLLFSSSCLLILPTSFIGFFGVFFVWFFLSCYLILVFCTCLWLCWSNNVYSPCAFLYPPLVCIEEMLRAENVDVNEQWFHSLMKDKAKESLSLLILLKCEWLVKRDLCHLRALCSLWLHPNNSKADYTAQHAGGWRACNTWLECFVILSV